MFKRLIKDDDGINIIKKSLSNISEHFTGNSLSTHTNAVWLSVFNEWCEQNFKTPVEETYIKLLQNLPICEILPEEEIEKHLNNYENHTLSFFMQNSGAADSSSLSAGRERGIT